MLIALDYDGTYTADRPLWDGFARAAGARGHEVVIVTARREGAGALVDAASLRVYYTNHHPARKYLRDHHGIVPEVWIDDAPETVAYRRLKSKSQGKGPRACACGACGDREFPE